MVLSPKQLAEALLPTWVMASLWKHSRVREGPVSPSKAAPTKLHRGGRARLPCLGRGHV